MRGATDKTCIKRGNKSDIRNREIVSAYLPSLRPRGEKGRHVEMSPFFLEQYFYMVLFRMIITYPTNLAGNPSY